jgi:hypothetical protein
MAESLSSRFRILQGLEHEEPTVAVFTARVLDAGLSEVRVGAWATSERSLDHVTDPVLRRVGDGHSSVVYEDDDAVLVVTLQGGFVHAQAAATESAAADRALASLRDRMPSPEPIASHDVPVTFWTYSQHGPIPSMRAISVPEWSEIRENYARRTREGLEAIMSGFTPAHGGQLILWHGEVGTGKTFALRALAWEWREWCQIHYIVDPDTFFGERADYLMSVLTQPAMPENFVSMPRVGMFGGVVTHGIYAYGDDFDEDEIDGDGDAADPKHWRLLVLEDTGELLRPDAKSIIGQGLSRFLNVVDGLIGQGLRVLVLVTTNEEIKTLHPAVARPGRCAADIEFEALSPTEASEWLSRHGSAEHAKRPRILASLYAEVEGRDPTEPPRTTGFGDV